jgi:nucleoside-diphosphate-sugar epimerase
MRREMTVMITGGAGNLGTKLAAHLSELDWCRRILLVDVVGPTSLPAKAEAVLADLTDPDGTWRSAAAEVDAIVHFGAVNPYPGCSWAEAAASFDMTSNLVLATRRHPCRFVFASSNHVMGRYKEEALGTGELTPDLPPLPGTRYIQNGVLQDSPSYATAKLMGERMLLMAARQPGSMLTGVALRIGWCQPGGNHPRTISADGLPVDETAVESPEAARNLRWFRNMWLSNRDFLSVFTAAITADASGWPSRGLVLNAMSNNAGMAWDLKPTCAYLGYEPQDDVWAVLKT